ncbi:MAG: M28 family peptidase [Candidatus Poribacteria bacterium]|nr:M28 family peptidase [Candidatus Poribacteria bacterium]MDE0502942.1 M28 family peptidase [Candidatus Poribacteria bacterium]
MRKLAFSILIFLYCGASLLSAQEELLLRIPENSNQQLRVLNERYGLKLRYRTPDFSIVQASRSVLPALHRAEVLDIVQPEFNYYLLRLGTRAEAESYGELLDAFDGTFLVKLPGELEGMLFEIPGHHRARLPIEVKIPTIDHTVFAPSASAAPHSQTVIESLLGEVDANRWFDLIKALVENEDLERPGHFFNSRYALRVRDAIQHDGRPTPDHACDNAAEYIAEQFRSYGLDVEFDSFPHHRRGGFGGRLSGEYVMRNVVATLPGKGPNRERIFLMTGHYDSISFKTSGWHENWHSLPAPGASDNASGIAEILETARILSQQDFDFTIRFVAFTGEELFLYGSQHYSGLVVQRGDQIAGVLNFDLLGHDEDGILDIHVLGDESSQWLVNAFGTAAQRYKIDVDLRLKNDPSFIFSDHSPFWNIGIPAVMVAEESTFDPPESTDYIHSEIDTLDQITLPLGKLAVELAVATLAELALPISESGEAREDIPDLLWEPAELRISQPTVLKGDSVLIDATLKNSGPVGVEEVTIQFAADLPDGTTEVISEQTTNLEVGRSQNLRASFTPSAWGMYTLRANVNTDTRVFESNFGNNEVRAELTVAGTEGDGRLVIENIMAYPSPVRFGTTNPRMRLSYVLNQDADVDVTIYTLVGVKVFERKFRAGNNGGRLGVNDGFNWNGNKSVGGRVAGGVYVCQIQATNSNGNSERAGIKVAIIAE